MKTGWLTAFFCTACMAAAASGNPPSPADSTYKHPVRGTVYLDENGNGKQDEGESGLSGTAVSDALDVVMTDESGAYRLQNVDKTAVFVFVHQPDDIRQSGQKFFRRLQDKTEPGERFDFGLRPANAEAPAEDDNPASDRTNRQPVKKDTSRSSVRFVQLSDSHVRNVSDREYMQQATTEIYEMDPPPDFVVATGDLVDWGVDEHFQNYVAGMQKPPVPYFHVFGNHEIVFGPMERYHQYIGPDYYSFERAGILFLVLNPVTPSQRQDKWLARTVELLGQDCPVVIFQHFPPSLKDLERFGQLGVRSVFSGHWHSEKEMEHADVQSVNSPPFIMGGIDASPAGFKVVHLDANGSAETEWRYGFQDKRLTIVSPREGEPVHAGSFPVIVNAYDTSHEIEAVRWRMGSQHDSAASGNLQRESASSWTSAHSHDHAGGHDHSHLPEGSYPFEVEVRDEDGESWTASRQVEVTSHKPASPAPGSDWPMFMGNAGHTGYTSGTIDDPPLRLAWSADTGGDPDFSSPVLADGRIYLGLKKRTRGRANGVAAFDPVTGERLWMFETPMAVNHTPAYAEGILCVAEMGGRIYGLDAATGRKQWHHDLIDDRGRYSYCAPAAHNGWFYAGVYRRIAKIGAADGHLDWEEQIGPGDHDWISSYGSPAVDDDFLAMSGMLFAGETVTIARTDDGSKVWADTADNGMLASATIAGDRVLFCSMKSILYARRLGNGEHLWSRELGVRDESGGGLATGGDAKWSATTPAVKLTGEGKGIVVAGSGDGHMSGVDLADGRILWTHVSGPTIYKVSPYRRDDRPLLSSPTIAGDKVFFGSADGHLYCLDLETGEQLWSFQIGVPVMSTPLVTGNAVYVAAYDGRLYAFTSGTD